jgi:cellulose synthase/poly-beta-1,6-N-acetylglucosamine synthase-like glycosyltransferase
LRALFWLSGGLLAWTQALYGVLLAFLARRRGPRERAAADTGGQEPLVTLIIAAYREEAVIAAKVANARALDWPSDKLEIVVAVDGDLDATAQRAREAGADVVLELPRGGKMRAQDAGVRAARGDLLAFSDANAQWEPGALRELVAAFDDPDVAYACGQVTFLNDAGSNQEGVYWRYEMWLRERESALASITAGNGAIYAVRRTDYHVYDPPMGHDLSFPFHMVKRGRRAVYVPTARATEQMVPTITGEWQRKRRMMNRAWQIVLISGIADLRGYPPLYALMIVSHRLLRYASPFLHVVALVAALALSRQRLYRAAAAAQLALLAAGAAGERLHARPLLIARYYVLTTASIAAGLADHLRHGTPAGWEQAEGTRV